MKQVFSIKVCTVALTCAIQRKTRVVPSKFQPTSAMNSFRNCRFEARLCTVHSVIEFVLKGICLSMSSVTVDWNCRASSLAARSGDSHNRDATFVYLIEFMPRVNFCVILLWFKWEVKFWKIWFNIILQNKTIDNQSESSRHPIYALYYV